MILNFLIFASVSLFAYVALVELFDRKQPRPQPASKQPRLTLFNGRQISA